MTIFEKLKELGFSTVDAEFYAKVHVWKSWYIGNVKGFHNYKVKTGKRKVNCKRYSLGMGKKVPEDWANLLMNEKVKITLNGDKEQAFVDDVFADNNFGVKCNEMQEKKFALGTVAYIPRVVGATVNSDGTASGKAERIELDYVTVEHIFPLSWKNGIINECAFDSVLTVDGEDYLYLQIHRKDENGKYNIENYIFGYNEGELRDANLADVKGFERVPSVLHTNSDQRQFVIDRPNIANNIDPGCPLGISVYANAIDVMESCDIAFDAFVGDFITGKRRLFVSPAATTYVDGEPAFDDNDLALYVLPEDTTGENKPIQSVGGTYAVEQTSAGVQTALNMLSSKCGMGENHYRFDNGNVTTATQVISENSTLFRGIKKHELVLNDALIELCRIILRLGNTTMNAGLNEEVDITIDFDDSIIEDTRTDNQDMRADVAAGLIRPELYIAKKYGVTEEDALKMMPKMEDMTDDEQDEVE